MPWRGPDYEGEFPTLGWGVLDWFAENLIVPDGPAAGEKLLLTDEQAQFILRFYRVDPTFSGPAIRGRAIRTGRVVRRGVLSRPKGWGKSPMLAGVSLNEALGDVVFDGWDANGEPVGRPWTSLGFKAKVQIMAVAESQTVNTWDPLLEMARNGPVADNYPIEAMDSFVAGPRLRIEYTTSAAVTKEGFRPVFVVADQTESWLQSNGGHKLAAGYRRNLAKVGGASIETPNAFVPGLDSVAERSHKAAELEAEGRTRGRKGGILLDHREAPADTDMTDRESLLAGLAFAYGDSADVNGGWVELERLLEDVWDPDTAPADARRYFLNQVQAAEDAWLAAPEWDPLVDRSKVVGPRDPVVLCFDGSRKRARGVTDSTALWAIRVSDGHIFEPCQPCLWEQPTDWRPDPTVRDDGWEVPVAEVDGAVDECFKRWNVVGFFADPAKWETYVATWERKYGARLKVKATREHPIEWWMTGGRVGLVVRALDEFHSAVVNSAADQANREVTHDGSVSLRRHVLNCRRRPSRSGLQISKEHPDSEKKIDAAVAVVIGWQARLQALAKLQETKRGGRPRRIRQGR